MNETKLVIFDLDGTLVDAYGAITESFNFTMRSLGYPAQSASTVRRAVGRGDLMLLKPFVAPADAPKALRVYRRHHAAALIRHARVMPGALALLEAARARGMLLAVASNRPTRFSLILLRHLGLRRFFSCVLCKDAVRYGKPHPLMLNMIMRRIGVTPSQTAYVGDMAVDVEAGRRARVRTIAIVGGSSSRAELSAARPDAVAKNLRDALTYCVPSRLA